MNTLEKEIIRRYRQVFPHDTLKVISQKTGIQITRVFRIMNGKPMKVSELESFENILNIECGEKKNLTEIDRLTKLAAATLSVGELEHIIKIIERKLDNFELKRQTTFTTEIADLIA